ncbi:hypothetical protein L6164_032531 [Bauhinia variegata]|uniref:Uncharacterized protein n=1 Tax=Bauhinia variegata TaxID=167791 RepID=A0ACB9KP13_BAUVA|nr:hypothetical protein L6164_032531 [Bauhinia variegata]
MESQQRCYGNLIMKELKPVMSMVLVQTAYAGMTILYKMADEDGMNLEVLISYRMMFASAFMVPLAVVVERRSRPPLTWFILLQALLLGGTLAQNLFIEGLALTSATFAAAMTNLMPAIAFIMAILFRLEKLTLDTLVGKAKVVGTAIGIGGAMVFTLYRDAVIQIWSTHVDLFHHPKDERVASSPRGLSQMGLGAFLSFCSGFSFVLWLIVQTKMSKRYPCYYSSTALMSIMASAQSVVFALCLERDWNQWKLGWNIRLLTAAYSGIVTSGLVAVLISWFTHLKGPLFVSIFNPLCLIIAALASSLVLQEKLHLGSILGGILIICGLYLVLWGKSKEMKAKAMNQTESTKNTEEPHSLSHPIEIVSASPANKDESNYNSTN